MRGLDATAVLTVGGVAIYGCADSNFRNVFIANPQVITNSFSKAREVEFDNTGGGGQLKIYLFK